MYLDYFLEKVETLRKKVDEKDCKYIFLEKEKEKVTTNALLERENFLWRMEILKEKNKMLEEKLTCLHVDIFGDSGAMRSKV